jgi:hypothetical protein
MLSGGCGQRVAVPAPEVDTWVDRYGTVGERGAPILRRLHEEDKLPGVQGSRYTLLILRDGGALVHSPEGDTTGLFRSPKWEIVAWTWSPGWR